MKATLEFNLPEEAEEHRNALDGHRYLRSLQVLDDHLRHWTKHGHEFKTPDEALQAARDQLHREMEARGIAVYP